MYKVVEYTKSTIYTCIFLFQLLFILTNFEECLITFNSTICELKMTKIGSILKMKMM